MMLPESLMYGIFLYSWGLCLSVVDDSLVWVWRRLDAGVEGIEGAHPMISCFLLKAS
jgi:hypothetical protein